LAKKQSFTKKKLFYGTKVGLIIPIVYAITKKDDTTMHEPIGFFQLWDDYRYRRFL